MKQEIRANARKPLEDIAAIVDEENGLPKPGRKRDPATGEWRDTLPGEPGWCLRVAEIEDDGGPGDRYSYPITDELADRVTAARGKPANARDPKEAKLAAAGAPRARHKE
jgi:hypothetical protein